MKSIGQKNEKYHGMASNVCSICLEEFFIDSNDQVVSPLSCIHGVFCTGGHFLCRPDLGQYCSENVFPSVYAIKNHFGKVTCPRHDCKESLDILTVYEFLGELERRRYYNIIKEIILPSDRQLARSSSSLCDVLVLSCPSCRVAVDPTPDACSAIQCLNCGFYYCNYCFKAFASDSLADNRNSAHEHAATHKAAEEGENRDAFLPLELVLKGQNEFQRQRLIKYLQVAVNSADRLGESMNGLQIASLGMLLAYDDIRQLGWNPFELWNDVLNRSGISFLSSISFELSSVSISGKSLALALLSQNVEAARQIITAEAESLDVNYSHPISAADNTEIIYPLTSLAILMEMDEIAEELLKLGADVMKPESTLGRSVMYIIIERGGNQLVDFVFKHFHGFDWNQTLTAEVCLFNALHVAARYDRGFLVKPLLTVGVDYNQEDQECFYTPLVLAVVLDHHWTATELIKRGADLQRKTSQDNSAAKIAAERGQLNILMTAFERDCTVIDAFGPYKTRILETAVTFRQYHVLEYLLDNGAMINYVNDDGSSPLITALLFDDEHSAMLLLSAGADIALGAFQRRKAMFMAVERGFENFIRAAHNKYPNCLTDFCTLDGDYAPLDVSLVFKKAAVTKLLLELGVSSNRCTGEKKMPPLYLAVREGNVRAMQLLIRHGSNLLCAFEGKSLLYAIIENGLVDAFYLYKQHVALDVNAAITEDEMRPLHIAAKFNHPHLISALMNMNADLQATNVMHLTALDLAREMHAKRAELALLAFY